MDTDVEGYNSDECEACVMPRFNLSEVREDYDRVKDENDAYLWKSFHEIRKARLVRPVMTYKDKRCKREEQLTDELIYHILRVVDDCKDKCDSSPVEKKGILCKYGNLILFSLQI